MQMAAFYDNQRKTIKAGGTDPALTETQLFVIKRELTAHGFPDTKLA